MKDVFRQAFGSSQPDFCHPPEPFDSVYMDAASGEFIPGMVNAIVAISQVHQSVVAAPAI